MPEPIAIAEFTSIGRAIVGSASFTRSRGVMPDAAILYIEPQATITGAVGTLTMAFGAVTRTWTGMVAHSQYMEEAPYRENARQVVVLLDRRWNWKNSYISLKANQRDATGAVIAATKKEPSEIATLCMDAMGETGYSVAGMATGMYPEINYEGRADILLQELCRLTAHLVVPSNDAFNIVKHADGSDLPTSGVVVNEYTVDRKDIPANVVVRTARTLFQSRLRLEAVAYDTDNALKLINSLSYKPTSGWEEQSPLNFLKLTATDRYLAHRDLFRLFRIKEQWAGGYAVASAPFTVSAISQYELAPALTYEGCPPFLLGVYWPRNMRNANTPSDSKVPLIPSFESELLVRLESQVYKSDSNKVAEADLGIVAKHYLRNGTVFATYSVSGSAGGTGKDEIIDVQSIQPIHSTYPTAGDNTSSVSTEANTYKANHLRKYTEQRMKHMQYEGIVSCDPTGIVAQVKHTVCQGELSLTEASRVKEFDVYSRSQENRERDVAIGAVQVIK